MSPDARLARRLFLLLLLLNSALHAFLILDRRLMPAHDTLAAYALGYGDFSQAAETGEPRLWIPTLAHGTTSTPLASNQGLLLHALSTFAPLLKGANYLILFHLSLFFDELLLLLGMWLLTRRLYACPYAAFFATAAAVGTSFWADQLHLSFRLTYALPLVLALLHRFADKGERWTLALASNLLGLQFLCQVPYVAALGACSAAAWFLVRMGLDPSFRGDALLALRPRPADAAWLPALLATPAAAFLAIRSGLESTSFHAPGRNPDGSVSLETFLTHGSVRDPRGHLDLLLGVQPDLDIATFAGALTVLFAGAALFARPGRGVLSLAATLLLFLFFSLGPQSFVAMLAYHLVPPMAWFRHVAMSAPLVKLFLILLSGFGVQALLRRPIRPPSRGLAAAVGAVAAGACLVLAQTGTLLWAFVVVPLAGAAVLRKPAALLAFQVLGTFGWEIAIYALRTAPLDDRAYAMQALAPLPYRERRSGRLEESDRYRALEPLLRSPGVRYDVLDAWFFADLDESPFRKTFRMKGRDDLAAAAPAGDAALDKIRGKTQPKLQVFAAAHRCARPWLPAFRGDVLLVEGPDEEGPPDLAARNERLPAEPEVLRFDSNRLELRVQAPAGAWLMYADAHHPGWTATVNGAAVRVERAFRAYKAVPLQAGENRVEFRFRDPLRAALYRIVDVNALLWVLGVAAAVLLVSGRSPAAPRG